MGQLNQDPTGFFNGVAKYRDQLAQHRGQLFGVAQKGDDPRLSDEDYDKYVLPNQDLTAGPKRNIPDFSKMRTNEADAAYDALPVGKVFIDTDGQAEEETLMPGSDAIPLGQSSTPPAQQPAATPTGRAAAQPLNQPSAPT